MNRASADGESLDAAVEPGRALHVPQASHAPRVQWLVLALILAAGLALRLAYLSELRDSPAFASPAADAAFHDYWARALASGDWTPPPGTPNPRIPEVPYLRPPGYPYALALTYLVTDGSRTGAALFQMALGLANCVLAFLLGRALAGRLVGLLTAAGCSVYWSLIYFEGELQPPVLIVTLILATLLLLHAWARRPGLGRAFAAGVALGALALVRANVLLFIPVAACWVWCAARRYVRRDEAGAPNPPTSAVTFALGACLAIAPAGIRNTVVADDFVLISSNGAINLYANNNAESDGIRAHIPGLFELTGSSTWSWFSYDGIVKGIARSEGREMSHSEVASLFTERAIDAITEDPGRFAALSWKRALLFFGPDEISNNRAIAAEKENSRALRTNLTFAMVVSLALVGALLLLAGKRGLGQPKGPVTAERSSWGLVALFVLTYFASFVPFLAAARFRVPLMPLFFLFAAYSIARCVALVRNRDWPKATALVAVSAVSFLVARTPFVDYDAGRIGAAWWHTDRAQALARNGQFERAVIEFDLAIEEDPGFFQAHARAAETLAYIGRSDEAIARYRRLLGMDPGNSEARLALARVLNETGRAAEAVPKLRTVLRTTPNLPAALFELGRALRATQDEAGADTAFRGALDAYRSMLEVAPSAEVHFELGLVLVELERHEEARDELGRAVRLDPLHSRAQYSLGTALLKTGAFDEAARAFGLAHAARPGFTGAMVNEGFALTRLERFDEAVEAFRRAVRVDDSNLRIRCNLVATLAQAGNLDEALDEVQDVLNVDPRFRMALDLREQIRAAQ